MKSITKLRKKYASLNLDDVSNWELYFESCEWIFSWNHINQLSSVEIQKNENNAWEAEYFKCDKKGFIVKEETLISSNDKEKVIKFAIGWMNHHSDGEWSNGKPYSNFDLSGVENWQLDEEYSCEDFISWNHLKGLLRFDIQRNEDDLWALEIIHYNRKGDLMRVEEIMLSDVKENTIEFAIDWMNQMKDGKRN